MLELKNIKKSYKTGNFTQIALNDVSLAFRDNEFVAILGPSGSGKTTLLNILGGLDHYDSGDLVIEGVSTKKYKDRDWDSYRNNRVGFVFQSYNLIPHQTILANVELALTLSGVSKEERRRRAKEALNEVGLFDHINKKPAQLSGGQMQRVAIARALINNPEILLADEPTGALDSKTSVQIMNLLTKIARDRLVVMVTHNPELAELYATRIVNLSDGILKSDSNPFDPYAAKTSAAHEEVAGDALGAGSAGGALGAAGATIATDSLGATSVAEAAEATTGAAVTVTTGVAVTATTAAANAASATDTADTNATQHVNNTRPANAANKRSKRTRMGFLTALSLSFNNLMTKKGRTIMTAFAGSIGIIGIAAILALANGVNNYIKNVEEDTLSLYPLQIMSTGFDMSSLMVGYSDTDTDATNGSADSSSESIADSNTNEKSNNQLKEVKMVTRMFDSVANNDLEALKQYFNQHEDELEQYASSIEYSYNVTLQIYSANTQDGIQQINPDSTFASLGLGSTSSTSSLMSMSMSTDIFDELMSDTSIVEEQYDVVAGSWPSTYNECVLVLSQSGGIADIMLYDLGLRDQSEIKSMVKQFVNDEEVVVPTDDSSFSYDDILNVRMKLVNAANMYTYDEDYQVWVDKSDDEAFMKTLIDEGDDLVISGIIQPKADAKVTALEMGIYYTPELTRHLIEEASETQIVKDQLANPTIDVFNGKSFTEEEESDDSSFDMNSLFSIDEDALTQAFSIDTSALSIDPSSFNIDISADSLPSIDTPSNDAFALNGGISIKQDALSSAVSTIMSDFQQHAAELTSTLVAGGANPSDSDFTQQLSNAYMALPSTQALIAELMPSLIDTSQMQEELASQMQSYMTQSMNTYINAITTNMKQQIQTALTQEFSKLSSSMANAMNIDTDAFANAFQFNINEDELSELMTSLMTSTTNSYDNNLAKLGYADFDKPYEIDIYPKDFDCKQEILNILDTYNQDMSDSGQEEKTITYTDLVGTLMKSVTTIINMISYVLIAFVAISLVVSSIMIGVITYISVLERKKEIGILRAIGASKGDISRVFNAETIIEGLVAGLLGVGITALCCIPANIIVYNMFDVANIAQLPIDAAIILVAISVVLTFIAGLIPARNASRKDPVEALRSE